MACRGAAECVPLLMIPEKRQGSCLEGVKPMSLKIFVIRLYQCWGDRLRAYSIFKSIQKLSGLYSVFPRGGKTMVILLYGSRVLQKAFLQSPCWRIRLLSVVLEVSIRREDLYRTGAKCWDFLKARS